MLKCRSSTERDQRLLQHGYHTEYHDTVCNSNPLEWWIGLSGSYLSEAEIASMEVLIHGWNWKIRSWELFPMLPSSLSLGLGPELFCYMAPLDNSLRQCLLLVVQRNACSSWKSVLEGNSQAKCGCAGECPQPAVSALVVLSLPWTYSFHFSSFGICTS